MRQILVLAVLAAGDQSAVAAQSRQSSYTACVSAAAGVVPALKACDDHEIVARERALNLVYQQLLPVLDSARRTRLRAAQRAWIAFRDAECGFRWSAEVGGTDAALIATGCRIALTGSRTDDLRKTLRIAQF